MTAADDANLDDLKRRARRRLVGAIVLALVVAVVVPMLLESDPKPLGEDVAVKIPPVDDGKFVNRLSDKGKSDARAAPGAKTEPKPEAPRTEIPKVDAPKSDPETAAPAPAAPAGDPQPVTPAAKTEAAAAPAAKAEPPKANAAANGPSSPAKSEASREPAKAESASSAAGMPAASPNGLFAVQVYAFSDNYGANSLVRKLKGAGYPAYSETTNTGKGTLYRVRIGPYASREIAAVARDKLKGEGYNGIVATK